MTNPLVASVQALRVASEQSFRETEVWTLGELLAKPALTQPPAAIIPSLVYEGRVTLLSGREKSGKSTLIGQALAALSSGATFLDFELSKRRTLWFALDEPLGDLVRRARDYGADYANFLVTDTRPRSAAHMGELIRRHGAESAVVDTLSDLWSGIVKNEKEASEVGSFLRPYMHIARETGAGIILLHHLPKAFGTFYRGSTALGAAVDILARLSSPRSVGADDDADEADEDGRRVLRVKGRGGISGTHPLSFDGVRYSRGDTPLPLRYRVLSALRDGPLTSNALVESLGKRKVDVLGQLRELRANGLVSQASPRAPLVITDAGVRDILGTDRGTEATTTQADSLVMGTMSEPARNHRGT